TRTEPRFFSSPTGRSPPFSAVSTVALISLKTVTKPRSRPRARAGSVTRRRATISPTGSRNRTAAGRRKPDLLPVYEAAKFHYGVRAHSPALWPDHGETRLSLQDKNLLSELRLDPESRDGPTTSKKRLYVSAGAMVLLVLIVLGYAVFGRE